jgi:hypothetical protein
MALKTGFIRSAKAWKSILIALLYHEQKSYLQNLKNNSFAFHLLTY